MSSMAGLETAGGPAARMGAALRRAGALPEHGTSLRFRLMMLSAGVLALGLMLALGAMVHGARHRIQNEVASSTTLARQLVEAVIRSTPAGWDLRRVAEEFSRDLPMSRHIRFAVVMPDQPTPAGLLPAAAGGDPRVPDWFERLINPPVWVQSLRVVVGDRRFGQILISANPQDEINEIWGEFKALSGLFAVLFVLIGGGIFFVVGRGLQPLQVFSEGLDRLEHGDFAGTIAPTRVPELWRIGEKINSLARSLNRAAADNRLLIGKLISVQETERGELARDLHDELGPCLFGIKVDANCILKGADTDDPRGRESRERAGSILALVDTVQQINRRILRRLRPIALKEIGIEAALSELVLLWRERNPETEWSLDVSEVAEGIGEPAGLTVYRMVQECLTNAARHAGAAHVSVRVDRLPSGAAELKALQVPEGRESIYVRVCDDGRGMTDKEPGGFGLLGIGERVRGLGGVLRVSSPASGGVIVEAAIPLAAGGK